MQRNYRLTRIDLEAVSQALCYIHREYKRSISIENLSVEVNLDKDKLQAGFKQATALTLHQYLVQVRIDKAKELLTGTDAPIKSIRNLTGFKDESYFCKVFRKHTRLTPLAFRLQQSQQ